MNETRTAPRASVIVPVYNAANTLAECLDSILNQTMPELEVICIDDGSVDNSWEILEDYANKDSRVRIVKQENQGSGMTRNHGIELATGTYILFVDSDDYILPTTLETVLGMDSEQDADIVLFDGDDFDDVTGKRIPVQHMLRSDLLPKDSQVFSVRSCPETIFQLSCPKVAAKAYRREMVQENGLRFSDMPNSEELCFSFNAMVSARSIACTTEKLYMHRLNQTANSESGKETAPLCFIEAYMELARFLLENDLFDLYKKSFGLRFCGSIIHAIKTIDSQSARDAICQRLCEEDISQLNVLDQSSGFYGNNHEVKQVRYLLQSFVREPITQPKVSVIIPVFNVEKYLEECLESLFDQTMPEFEVLCMDDGSTDGSIGILNLYSRLDSRIRVVFGDHLGAGEARNQGIDLASGEYLYFMDSDDMAADTLLEKAYITAVEARADVVAFGAQTFNMQNGKIDQPPHLFRKQNAPVGKPVFSVADASSHIFQISNPAPWTKLIRRQFVMDKDLRYQNLSNSNDTYFIQMVMALAQRITLLDEPLYTYRTGMTTNIQSKKEKSPECVVEAYVAIYERLKKERIWRLCEKSWLAEFLAAICFTLKTVSTREAYQRFYQRLMQPDLAATRYMEHEETFYPSAYHYNLTKKFLSSPIRFAGPEERNTEILIRSACEDPVVSVIIPCYNVEDYLAECISSIQNQTLQNLEIICINDGSKDNTLSIICEEAKKDKRITVITQKNAGQSAARNAGIQAARGKYLYYMDSDDILEPNTLQFLVEKIKENELDCVFFGGTTFYESEELKRNNSGYENYYQYRICCDQPMSGPELFAMLVRASEYRVSPCMQMVSTELVRENSISFYEGIIYEDNLYTLQVILHSERCMALAEQFYLRRVRDESTMTSEVSVGNVLGYLVCYAESLSVVNKFDLTGGQYEAVCTVQANLVNAVRKFFNALPSEVRLWIPAFCTGKQRSIFKTLVKLFEQKAPAAPAAAAPAPANAAAAKQEKRLNDHDAALRNAQGELNRSRTRLNDHDTALRNAQKELAQNRTRLNDHDTALGYAQEALAQNRTRLNDHDTALGYAQEALAVDRKRLNDHDTALHYAHEERVADRYRLDEHDTALGRNRDRLNDHDVALGYLQATVEELRSTITQMQNSAQWKLGRIITWLPRKLKALLRH